MLTELLETRDILPGLRWLTWRAPEFARRAQAGQVLHVLAPRPVGLLLPVVALAGFDRAGGTIDLLLDAGSTTAALLGLRPGDVARLDGPIGQGFEVDPRSRHLLIVTDAGGLSRVRALLVEAVASGRQVTLLLGASSAAQVPPSSLLPDEVEYVVATDDGSLGHAGQVSDLLLAYEAWADQCFAAGAMALLESLATLARGRDARLGVARLGRRRGRRAMPAREGARRRSWLQVAVPYPLGCALGVCLGCVILGTDGPQRACREGPAFGSDVIAWEERR